MDKVKGFCVSFLKKLVEGCVGFIGGNLERLKGINFIIIIIILIRDFFIYYEVSIGIRSG
jgi:hypothetical protein